MMDEPIPGQMSIEDCIAEAAGVSVVSVSDETGGKYYRTELVATLSDGRKVDIELSSSDYEPSYIEKKAARESGYEEDYFCDGHYEREATRIVADKIIRELAA